MTSGPLSPGVVEWFFTGLMVLLVVVGGLVAGFANPRLGPFAARPVVPPPPAPPVSDLSLVPTDDLVAALKARFDHMIFSGIQVRGEGVKANEHREAWEGHVTMCAGMATDLIRAMQDWARDTEHDEDDA